MARNRLVYLAALAGVTAFHIYYTLWFSWFLLIFTLSLPLFSLLISLPALLTARLKLEAPAGVPRGQDAFASLKLMASYPGVLIRFRPAPGTRPRRIILAPGSPVRLPIQTRHCTIAALTLKKIRLMDLLGLFSFPMKKIPSAVTEIRPVPAPPRHLPDVTRLKSPPLRPKAGGGCSEIHEHRDYRPGDAMRDIHWKLSVKTDSLLVREPQEEVRTQAVLALRLEGPGDDADSSLDQLRFLSPWLLEQGIPHRVLCFCGPGDVLSLDVADEDSVERAISALLRRLPELSPWEGPFTPEAGPGGWLYTITPENLEVKP